MFMLSVGKEDAGFLVLKLRDFSLYLFSSLSFLNCVVFILVFWMGLRHQVMVVQVHSLKLGFVTFGLCWFSLTVWWFGSHVLGL